jgi:hypothetical protein
MEKLNTRLFLKTKQDITQSQPIQIRRGIFQWDSLSPLFFYIAFIPLTDETIRADCGYQVHGTERKINHLLYMDVLKLAGRDENDLKKEIKIVQTIRKETNMNLGSQKCARTYLKQTGPKEK